MTKDTMKKIICFFRTIWATLHNFKGLLTYGAYTSGHEYKETFSGIRNGREEQDLVCEVCGHKETGWE